MRYAIDISFDGTSYAGWQRQHNAISVQQRLEEALEVLLRQPTAAVGAGRTDAGVHARKMIVHFDAETALPPQFLHSLNGILPFDIAAKKLFLAQSADFHARFSATARGYTYQIVQQKSPLMRQQAMWVRHPLDLAAMQAAAGLLREYSEFGSFCKAHADNQTNICRIDRAEWEQQGELLLFHIQADRFLRGMVRAIVGSLLWVGSGKWSVERFREVIEAQDRSAAGPAADAQGLFLTVVEYPEGMLSEIAG